LNDNPGPPDNSSSMKRFLALAALGIAVQCDAQAASDPSFPEGDGSTCDKAVVLSVESSLEAVRAEGAWLRSKHGGGRKISQALAASPPRWYDLIEWETPDGSKVTTCFDITRSYEKFRRGLPEPK
jgi:hypothetical protein